MSDKDLQRVTVTLSDYRTSLKGAESSTRSILSKTHTKRGSFLPRHRGRHEDCHKFSIVKGNNSALLRSHARQELNLRPTASKPE